MMMDRHNRKSYLAPPAPKALTRDGSRDSSVFPSTDTDSSGYGSKANFTPTSGEIPIVREASATGQSFPSLNYTPSPALSLQHLSLETNDMPNGSNSRANRLATYDTNLEPASAIEPTSRPFFPPRTASSNSALSARSAVHTATLPIRPAPPPSGPLPPPPVSAGIGNPHRHR